MTASPAALIDAERLAQVRTLFAAETSEGVSLGLALLESLGASPADFDAALAPPVGRAVACAADGWLLGDEHARSEYDRYHRLVVAPRFRAEREADSAAGRTFLELVEIPAGEFEMGSEEDDYDEQPVHRVRITRAFLLGKTTVTLAQWWSVMGTRPECVDYGRRAALVAAHDVAWVAAVEFCVRLTKLERSSGKLRGNQRYRLPTEAEWEYACRAGTRTRFSFGDDESRLGEFASNRHASEEAFTHEVGRRKPNAWGLHDMHGDIWEWCSDWYDPGYYAMSPAADPAGPDAGSSRVLRGGSWEADPVECESASRDHFSPTRCGSASGFRVVCELE